MDRRAGALVGGNSVRHLRTRSTPWQSDSPPSAQPDAPCPSLFAGWFLPGLGVGRDLFAKDHHMLYLWIWIVIASMVFIADFVRGMPGPKAFVGALIWPILLAIIIVLLPVSLVRWVLS